MNYTTLSHDNIIYYSLLTDDDYYYHGYKSYDFYSCPFYALFLLSFLFCMHTLCLSLYTNEEIPLIKSKTINEDYV